MIEIRTLSTHSELKQAIQLCNEVFFQCDSFFERRYPHVFNLQNKDYLFAAFDDQKLISFVATYPSVLQLEDRSLNACALGAVCTHPDYRGQGLSFSILERLEDQLKERVDFLFISGEGKNYLRFGAQSVGQLYEAHLPKVRLDAQAQDYITHNSIESLDVHSYLKVYDQKANPKFIRHLDELTFMLSGHFEAKQDETNLILESKDHQSFVCLRIGYEQTQKLAYMIENVGDFKLCLDMAKACARDHDVDKLFYRTALKEEVEAAYRSEITMTGTFKVIHPSLKLSALDLFGHLDKKGIYPSFRVDDLNFL
jgi:GNAT superfamily N-acetyltransferase